MSATERTAIRAATAADAVAVHTLITKLAKSIPSPQQLRSSSDDLARAMSGTHPAIHALIAERKQQAMGVLVYFMTFSTWYGTPGVYVQDIYVRKSARGEALGRRLLAAVSKLGADQGADHLRLSVERDNAAAQAFYERLGLTRADHERIYMIEGDAFNKLKART